MRHVIFVLSMIALAAVVAARAMLGAPSPAAAEAMAQLQWDSAGYNVRQMALPVTRETAGNALIAEMDSYYMSRTPTAKNTYTGLFSGRNLILILAENWAVSQIDGMKTPALYRLWSEGARFAEYYAPDWYQALDGREFALLTGMIPTAVRDRTALDWAGERDIYLPFALARCLGEAGYACRAWPGREGSFAAYTALGFASVESGETDLGALAGEGPFFAYLVWPDEDGETALEELMDALEAYGLEDNTAVCLVAGHTDMLRGHLFLWGAGLKDAEATGPCSELDVTATLLNLFGMPYDARFLSGRDVFAPAGDTASGNIPLVSLYGSAYSDWVTALGCYITGEELFFPADGSAPGQGTERYVSQVCQTVYDRYVFARRVMENNYFRVVMSR